MQQKACLSCEVNLKIYVVRPCTTNKTTNNMSTYLMERSVHAVEFRPVSNWSPAVFVAHLPAPKSENFAPISLYTPANGHLFSFCGHYLTQIIQKFLSSVLRRLEFEQLRMFVDEISVQHTVQEFLIFQHVQQERNIRFDATDAELSERTIHLRCR